jgi:hypothetical protein
MLMSPASLIRPSPEIHRRLLQAVRVGAVRWMLTVLISRQPPSSARRPVLPMLGMSGIQQTVVIIANRLKRPRARRWAL